MLKEFKDSAAGDPLSGLHVKLAIDSSRMRKTGRF
jgi:hypothetical protein